tara:strand:- start:371 stop:1309 length:939 start_codon:yes stop_codon:yes gene_type:complete
MKKFVINMLFFGISTITLLFLILISFKTFHIYTNSDMYYGNEFNNAFKNRNYELLSIGNSKSLSAIDMSTLKNEIGMSSVNLAYSSANMSVSKLTLESYLNKCIIIPKIVLLEVSWFSFNNRRTNLQSISGDLFLNDFKLFKHFDKYAFKMKSNIKTCLLNQLRNIFYSNNLTYSVRNKQLSPKKKSYTFKKEKMLTTFPYLTAGIDELLLNDFYQIINMCKRNNIKLILYTSPEDQDYSKNQLDKGLIENVFKNSLNKYKNLYYLNYSLGGGLWKKKYENWLRDSHHINHKELFTKVLTKDIFLNTNLSKP